MRIAISGAHATGKSTLVAELAQCLPSYETVEEPYYALLAEGHVFADRPGVEDFAVLLERSLATLCRSVGPDILFDRCPADYLAYLAALHRRASGSAAEWVAVARDAMARLDLVVFVPVEQPDRVQPSFAEGLGLRKRVDALLRDMLLEDGWGLGVPAMAVAGAPSTRAHQVLRRLAGDARQVMPGPPSVRRTV